MLDARPHVLYPARSERLHHQPAQTGVVGRILLQHHQAKAAKGRLIHDLGAVAADAALWGNCPLAEALVADHEARFGVAAGDEYAERGEMHRIGDAHPLVMRIGVADEFRGQRVEERFARRSLDMLVHGDLCWFPHRMAYRIAVRSRRSRVIRTNATRYTIVSSCILT